VTELNPPAIAAAAMSAESVMKRRLDTEPILNHSWFGDLWLL